MIAEGGCVLISCCKVLGALKQTGATHAALCILSLVMVNGDGGREKLSEAECRREKSSRTRHEASTEKVKKEPPRCVNVESCGAARPRKAVRVPLQCQARLWGNFEMSVGAVYTRTPPPLTTTDFLWCPFLEIFWQRRIADYSLLH